MKSTADRPSLVALSSRNRSRVTNGADLLPNIDGRTATARRYRDLANALVVDAGGLDRCSEARLSLIRRFAAASVLAELLEAKLANGGPVDIAEHAALSSTLVRLAAKIGIDRRARTVVPSVRDYIEGGAAS
jgi:hypothetical protein